MNKKTFSGRIFVLPALALLFSEYGFCAYEMLEEVDYTATGTLDRGYYSKELPEVLLHKGDDKFYENALRTKEFILGCADDFSPISRAHKFLFGNISSRKQLPLLQYLFPDILDSKEDWESLSEVIDRLYFSFPTESEKVLKGPAHREEWVPYMKSAGFYAVLEETVDKIAAILKKGDTLITVGNTPQFIGTALEFSRYKIKAIPIALSSAPGRRKEVFDAIHSNLNNIVTKEGLANYTDYLERMGVSPDKLPPGKIYLMDYIESGRGPEFLIQIIHQMYKRKGRPQPDLNIISIGYNGRGPLHLRSLKIDYYPLELDNLAEALDVAGESSDYVANPNRVLPNFPAWKWHFWEDDPDATEPGVVAVEIMNGIRSHFKAKEQKKGR